MVCEVIFLDTLITIETPFIVVAIISKQVDIVNVVIVLIFTIVIYVDLFDCFSWFCIVDDIVASYYDKHLSFLVFIEICE
jgi:hypothetical protein